MASNPKARGSGLRTCSRQAAENNDELVALNLTMTYPVQWSRFKVLRDFVQNFFDAVPPDQFASRIEIAAGNRTAEIVGEGVDFSHEWLVPLGASTKTATIDGQYAGYFGEGFKIAALCALRDEQWQISAGARDWRLTVTTAPLCIDGAHMDSLAYRVERGLPSCSNAWLRLEGLDEEAEAMLVEAVRWSFYYPDNPLLAECLWSDSRAAVWRRSDVPLPRDYPSSSFHDRGVLFVGRQARGTHELPFGVAIHDAHSRDRDRETYFDFQVVDALASVARRLPPAPSMALLEAASRKWRECRKRRHECGSWEPVVQLLAKNVAKDPAIARQWRRRYPRLLVLEPLPRGSTRSRNERSEAKDWMRLTGGWRLVQSGFRELGYPTLEQACEAAGGFMKPVSPTPEQARRITLLTTFVQEHLADLIPLQKLPVMEVRDARQPSWGGAVLCHPRRRGPLSSRGRRVRYDLVLLALARTDLTAQTPQRALATLLHELCHAFGGDGSYAFPAALTDVLERVAGLGEQLSDLAVQWTSSAQQRRDDSPNELPLAAHAEGIRGFPRSS